jgi:cytosine/creatinine deaminase
MDLILREARIAGRFGGETVDIGIAGGRIAAIEKSLAAEGETLALGGRLVSSGFVETHIHLDKSRIVGRCSEPVKRNPHGAMEAVRAVKPSFTVEDVHTRAGETLERAILHGTTHMRTHVELDPGVGLRSFEAIKALAREYKWAIDLTICVFPQEGMTNNPGTEELMIEALKTGADLIGAAPNYDADRPGQIHRVFEIAREFDVDIDMHLDSGASGDQFDLDLVCELTRKYGYGGRVAIGHVTKLTVLPPERFTLKAKQLADAGVALTVLPATDLFLMGRDQDHSIRRGVVHAHELLKHGVNCSLATNNVLNPFTPFGDCSPVRMANLYANITQVGRREDLLECFEMFTRRPARLLRLAEYGIEIGKPADLVVLDHSDPAGAIAEVAAPLYGFKRGRRTFTRRPAELHKPS